MNEIASVMRHRREFARAIANNKYDVSPAGILFPEQHMFVGGVFHDEQRRFEPSAKRRRQRKLSSLPLVGPAFRRHRLRQGGGDLIAHGAISANIIPTESLNHILDVILHASTQVTAWYVALFEGNVTPGASLTAATFTATTTECTAYDESTRVAYNEGAAAAGVTSNADNRAVFTMNASKTVYGGALLSASAKSATTGVLLAAAKFSSSRAVVDDDELAVKYTITATSS